MTTLLTAHTQWLTRPPDERFPDLASLQAFTQRRAEGSSQGCRQLAGLRLAVSPEGAVALNGATPWAYLTHWAFGQLAAKVGAPARYLRTLPPEVVRDCLTHGLQKSSGRCKLLFRASYDTGGAEEQVQLAAVTGPDYGRIMDADVVDELIAAVEGTGWHVPPAYPQQGRKHAGLYASDRDLFAFLVHDEGTVEVGNARLHRGFFLWNSETGASTLGLTTFLFNEVCGNHIVWGAEQVQDLRIIHRKQAPERFTREALPMLNRFVESRPVSDAVTAAVAKAMGTRIGDTPEQVIEWFAGKPFTKNEILVAYQAGIGSGEDVSTVWGMIQGLTALSRSLPFANARVDLERRAGALLS